ncbi:MAG: hypothetical protein ACJA1L_002066 [Paracoccaceae bacterium]|jgi:hypothetical protein
MSDVFPAALWDLLTFQHLLYMMIGVLIGLAIRVFPGLGDIADLSLPISFSYRMESVSAHVMPGGLVTVILTSDTFSLVLIGSPGSSASQAAVLNGFAPAKQRRAARAVASLRVVPVQQAVRRAVRRRGADRLGADRAAIDLAVRLGRIVYAILVRPVLVRPVDGRPVDGRRAGGVLHRAGAQVRRPRACNGRGAHDLGH